MNSASSFISSAILHIIIIILVIGFSWNKSPTDLVLPSEKETPIIEASLVFDTPKIIKKIKPEPELSEKIEKREKPEKPEKFEKLENIEKTIAIKSDNIKKDNVKKEKEKIKEIIKEPIKEPEKIKTPVVVKSDPKPIEKTADKQLVEDALLAAIKEEEAQEEAARIAALTEIQKHMAIIKSAITRNWRQPLDIPTKGLSCTVVVSVSASGDVANVRIVKGSGNLAFDRSTELAVRKASPLPLPKSEAARAAFQEFEFGFYPEGV